METEKTTLVPKALAAVAAFLAVALPTIAPMLPTVGAVSLSTVAVILSFVFAALAGLALPQVKFAANKPLLPLTLVPVVASVVPVVMQLAAATTGILSTVMQAVALLLSFLAGLASPEPLKVLSKETKKEVTAVLGK